MRPGDVVDRLWLALGCDRLEGGLTDGGHRVVGVNDRLEPRDARFVVRLAEVDRARDLRVHGGAAELLAVRLLADGRLHECRSRQVETASLGHDQRIAEHREIPAARDAVAHDRRHLCQAGGREYGVVPEDASEVVGVGEDVFLQWQEHARGVDEIDQRQPRPFGDHLGADELLAGHREERAGLDRGIVGDDHAELATDLPDGGDQPCPRGTTVLPVHIPRREEPALEAVGAGVQQPIHTFAGGQPVVTMLALNPPGPAALADLVGLLVVGSHGVLE